MKIVAQLSRECEETQAQAACRESLAPSPTPPPVVVRYTSKQEAPSASVTQVRYTQVKPAHPARQSPPAALVRAARPYATQAPAIPDVAQPVTPVVSTATASAAIVLPTLSANNSNTATSPTAEDRTMAAREEKPTPVDDGVPTIAAIVVEEKLQVPLSEEAYTEEPEAVIQVTELLVPATPTVVLAVTQPIDQEIAVETVASSEPSVAVEDIPVPVLAEEAVAVSVVLAPEVVDVAEPLAAEVAQPSPSLKLVVEDTSIETAAITPDRVEAVSASLVSSASVFEEAGASSASSDAGLFYLISPSQSLVSSNPVVSGLRVALSPNEAVPGSDDIASEPETDKPFSATRQSIYSATVYTHGLEEPVDTSVASAAQAGLQFIFRDAASSPVSEKPTASSVASPSAFPLDNPFSALLAAFSTAQAAASNVLHDQRSNPQSLLSGHAALDRAVDAATGGSAGGNGENPNQRHQSQQAYEAYVA